jgi:aspartyl-tRNA synthetase
MGSLEGEPSHGSKGYAFLHIRGDQERRRSVITIREVSMKQETEKFRRTHTCGGLTKENAGEEVNLVGWVNRRRDLGGLIFIDLRDRYGMTQVVFNPKHDEAVFHQAENLKNEFVIAVKGRVSERPEGTRNANLSTGDIELFAQSLFIINQSKVPPFTMTDGQNPDEMLRMKYRYLDLRRPHMIQKVMLRHRVAKIVRDYFDSRDFLEIETPMLVRSTPEGARDYLVPSRVNQGKFYALPQSPQLFKQLLMVSGVDRYFQMARCFRDEDLRADRQPEFTQIDLEMSFVSQEDILSIIEEMLLSVFKITQGITLELPFPRLTYHEAMERYGTDKPDVRFGMEILDLSGILGAIEFEVFKNTLAAGGRIKGMKLPGYGHLSRKEIEEVVNAGKAHGLKGLITAACLEDGMKSLLCKYLPEDMQSKLLSAFDAHQGDLIMVAADEDRALSESLGKLRLELASKFKLIPPKEYRFLWVLDFPLFKYNSEEGKIEAEHHPFTSPKPEDTPLMESAPLEVRANAYDLVLNGVELGSGSIRIHDRALQEKLFSIIGLSEDEAQAKFGFLLNAFDYGAPPHGGIALGFDRLIAIMSGVESIREVLVFPKNQSAACPLTGAPVEATQEQLKLLRIAVDEL